MLERLAVGRPILADWLFLRPELILMRAGYRPDPWQISVLRHIGNRITCCSRQRGKTLCAAASAIATAMIEGPCYVLYTARTLRQVWLFMRRVRDLYLSMKTGQRRRWKIVTFKETFGGREAEPDIALEEKLAAAEWASVKKPVGDAVSELVIDCGNGHVSRIVGIPPKEETVRGYDNVARIIIDEASRLPDDFFRGCGAFMATTGGYRDVYSTPFGQRGIFWELFEGPRKSDPGWKRTRINVLGCEHSDPMCPACRAKSIIRITPTWLEQERREIGERWYRQEYKTSFEANVGQLIPQEQIQAASLAGKGRPPIWQGW